MDKSPAGRRFIDLKTYLVDGVFLQLAIRVFMSTLQAIDMNHTIKKGFLIYFFRNLKGFHPNDLERKKSDFWYASILGPLELWSYPILMATGAWTVIGAWLGFKTIAQWRNWNEDRISFNRYLIGNALVVLAAYLILVPYIKVTY